jgi:hypothetical protein
MHFTIHGGDYKGYSWQYLYQIAGANKNPSAQLPQLACRKYQ